jgi:hypothetical protein
LFRSLQTRGNEITGAGTPHKKKKNREGRFVRNFLSH